MSSEERILNIFDYTIGAFYDKQKGTSIVVGPASFLPGAFGRPGTAPVKMAPLDRYFLKTSIDISPTSVEKSLFGNITAHITEATELSVGGRYIDFKRHDRFTLGLQPGFVAIQTRRLQRPADRSLRGHRFDGESRVHRVAIGLRGVDCRQHPAGC